MKKRELEELRRPLDQKTKDIESLIAKERGLGSIEDMDSADYERLQRDVEELLDRWEQADQEALRRAEDSPLNRLVAERFEIEQQIELLLSGKIPRCWSTDFKTQSTDKRAVGLEIAYEQMVPV
jgi:hypothetical protein